MLQAADLTFAYDGRSVVSNVSLDVADDGFVGIIGPNGSGKTTLLRLLAGTRQPKHGRVSLDGAPLHALTRAAVARRMAVVPQETHLAFEYSVLEVVLMGRYPHLGAFALEGPADIRIAREALAATGTLPLETRPFSTLSGGEKQRVIIAAALAQVTGESGTQTRSKVLLLDEPTTALDLKHQLRLERLLRSLHARDDLAVVISTHDLNFAAALCATVVMLKDGRVLASGAVEEVLTAARIGELYDVDAEIARHPRTGRLTVTPLGAGDRV